MPRPKSPAKLVLLRKRGWTRPIYVIRYYDGTGRRRMLSTGESDPGRAGRAFEDWAQERARKRRAGPDHPATVIVEDVILNYVEEHSGEVVARDTLKDGARPLLWFFGGRETVAQLTPKRVKEYWTWRRGHSIKTEKDSSGKMIRQWAEERPIGDGTVIRELAGILRPAIKHAIAEKRLAFGKYHIPVPPTPAGRDYWITRDEAARLLRETRRDSRARHHLPLYALIALYTGQRRGAILDLTWRQIDLVAGLIYFNAPGRIQTKKKRPVIQIPRSLKAALRRAQKRAECAHVIAYRGEPVRDIKTGFNSAAARAGIPDCTSHTLRHTAGTWMAQRGVSLFEIGGWLGHSEKRTSELYAHHHPSYLETARKAFER